MNDDNPNNVSPYRILWILVITLLIVLAIVWFLDPFGEVAEPAPVAESAPPTAEFTTAPEEPGVEVNLPETEMTNEPVTEAAE